MLGANKGAAMSYVSNTLGAKERLCYRTGYHWLYWFAAYALAAPALAIAMGGYPFEPFDYVLGAAALIALPFGLIMLVRAYATEIVVTSERLIVKHGLISYSVDEIYLDTIEEVDVLESILGRILGFGRVEVHGAGNANIVVDFVSRPDLLRHEIQDARGHLHGPGAMDAAAVAA
jgi:hypothetical protein